jgi:branched-chain amino acid transport system ATP-binding protein
MTQENGIALKTSALKKAFGPIEIIRGVDLEVRLGERHALIGPNGAGKSTMFELLSAAIGSTSGDIELFGRSILGCTPAEVNHRGLSRSFQITSIFPKMTVFENLQIGVFARRGIRSDAMRRAARIGEVTQEVDEMIATVRLQDRRGTLAGDLPYSEQRALELALTLATDPQLLLLDEPTAGMSRQEAEHTVELIQRTTAGRTLLVVEHDMDVVFKLCDRISVLVYGQIIATGEPDAIRNNVDVQTAYLGSETP